jgi:hypothetical protein
MMEQPLQWQFLSVTLNFKMIKIQILVFLMGLFIGFLIGVLI